MKQVTKRIAEIVEERSLTKQKAKQLAEILSSSKSPALVFTGAGISTTAGIPDYRSDKDTVLEVGGGTWKLTKEEQKQRLPTIRRHVHGALPTVGHMAIKSLIDAGYLGKVFSQNTDGLHLKSGIERDNIIEIHGNICLEECQTCHSQYLRDFRARTKEDPFEHETGRLCDDESCGGKLYDKIINFGEKIPQDDIKRGLHWAASSDVCLCMGSSLVVRPANIVPLQALKSQKKLAIINLQTTALDEHAYIRSHAMSDHFMSDLCDELGVTIQNYSIKRKIKIDGRDPHHVKIDGLDAYNHPYSFISKLEVLSGKTIFSLEDGGPYRINKEVLSHDAQFDLRVHFQGHNGEPELDLVGIKVDPNGVQVYESIFNPFEGKFEKVSKVEHK